MTCGPNGAITTLTFDIFPTSTLYPKRFSCIYTLLYSILFCFRR
jgi:hypothetical protein